MKKILYIITQSDWGGAQRYVFDLATNLHKSQEYKILVAAGGYGELFTRLEAKNLPMMRLKHLVRAIRSIRDLLAYFELKKLIKTFKPHIVHLNSSKAGVLGSLAARKLGVPKIIYTAHGFVFNEPLSPAKKWLYKKIELFSSKRINKIITVSDYDRQTGIQAGIAPDKLVTIHNGIDLSLVNFLPKDEARLSLRGVRTGRTTKQSYNRNKEGPPNNIIKRDDKPAPSIFEGIASVGRLHSGDDLPRNDTWIGCVANFYPTKGLDILIRAMTRVDAQLIIIGDGQLRRNLENLIRELCLEDKICLPGYLENAGQYLKAFDLFVLPSLKEGLPYTLLEAAAARVPIVASRVGGVPEIIQDGINGYLAPPDDADALADTIIRSLNNPLPPTITGFDLATMLQKTQIVYKQQLEIRT
jgi:glycosyltransferase involved in cell wall biosynthesis